jgi:hypothetical protein
VVSDAIKKNREVFAYGLLGVAALYFISGLSLLFKSGDDLGGAGFADKAALFGYVFTHPLSVLALFGAVALVTGWSENSNNAKTIVLVALGIGGISILFAVVCWLSAFGADSSGRLIFNGVFGAGKVVGIFLGLAQLILLGLVLFYAFTVYQTFPKPARAQHQQGQWGQQAGWGQQQQGWGQQQGGYDQGQPQQGWGQQQGGYDQGQPQQGWGQQQGGYDQGQPQQGWGQQQGGYDPGASQWGAASTGGAAAGWGDQSATQAEHQGQPAASWDPSEQPATGQAPASGLADPSATPAQDETQIWSGRPDSGMPPEPAPGEPGQPGETGSSTEEERKDDDPPQQGWWQQPSP